MCVRGLSLLSFFPSFCSENGFPSGSTSNTFLLASPPPPRSQALKLAERMLAFADSRLLLAEAHLARARALDGDTTSDQAQYNGSEVLASYQKAVEANPEEVMAQLGVGACFVRTGASVFPSFPFTLLVFEEDQLIVAFLPSGRTEQYPAAINAYETLLRRQPKCVEALAALASIHTHLAFTFHSVSDSSVARKAAKDSYAALLRIISAGTTGAAGGADQRIVKSERVRVLASDRDLYVEVARLWSDEGTVERSLQAWEKAVSIEEEKAEDEDEDEQEEEVKVDSQEDDEKKDQKDKKDPVDPRIRNNLGVQHFNRRPLNSTASDSHLTQAVDQFQLALLALSKRPEGLETTENDAVLTVLTFNAGAAYEALGEREKAKAAWEQVLRGHPEFVEGALLRLFLSLFSREERTLIDMILLQRTAKARLARLLLKKRDRSSLDAAHVLLKEALTSLPTSSELRALYTYFLVETGQPKLGREFARSTIKEISRHDLYALCASGALYYHDARENKSSSKEALKDRTQKFTRSAEFFEKALQLSPQCAFAAQGLAIALAEGALGNGPADTAIVSGTGGQAPQALTEQQARLRNARDALGVLMKVKESINDASVYVNIGHCHFARDEYEKAIENVRISSSLLLLSFLLLSFFPPSSSPSSASFLSVVPY
jgi:RNA polymerase-associated protein CTR9